MGKVFFVRKGSFVALLALLSVGMLTSSAHAFFFPKQINAGPGNGQNPVMTPHSPSPPPPPPSSPLGGPGPSPGGGPSPAGSGSAPEPATLITVALGAGLLGLFSILRRRARDSV
jgi:hypothetical protein